MYVGILKAGIGALKRREETDSGGTSGFHSCFCSFNIYFSNAFWLLRVLQGVQNSIEQIF